MTLEEFFNLSIDSVIYDKRTYKVYRTISGFYEPDLLDKTALHYLEAIDLVSPEQTPQSIGSDEVDYYESVRNISELPLEAKVNYILSTVSDLHTFVHSRLR